MSTYEKRVRRRTRNRTCKQRGVGESGGRSEEKGGGDNKFTHVCCIRKAAAIVSFLGAQAASRGLVALENHDVGLAASGARGEHAELLVLVDQPMCGRCHEPASGRLWVRVIRAWRRAWVWIRAWTRAWTRAWRRAWMRAWIGAWAWLRAWTRVLFRAWTRAARVNECCCFSRASPQRRVAPR